jgi:hypothetical protein
MITTLYNIQEKLRAEYKNVKRLARGRKSLEHTYAGFFDNVETWVANRNFSTVLELADLAGVSLNPAMELLAYKCRMKHYTMRELSHATAIAPSTLSGFYRHPLEWASNKQWHVIQRLIDVSSEGR